MRSVIYDGEEPGVFPGVDGIELRPGENEVQDHQAERLLELGVVREADGSEAEAAPVRRGRSRNRQPAEPGDGEE